MDEVILQSTHDNELLLENKYDDARLILSNSSIDLESLVIRIFSDILLQN
jgi:hypothetical protein